jgi:acyl carrier protein
MKVITKEDIFKMVEESELNFNEDISLMDPDELFTKQGLDSLDMANFLFELENYYNISISDESIANGDWKTLNKMLASLNKLVNE